MSFKRLLADSSFRAFVADLRARARAGFENFEGFFIAMAAGDPDSRERVLVHTFRDARTFSAERAIGGCLADMAAPTTPSLARDRAVAEVLVNLGLGGNRRAFGPDDAGSEEAVREAFARSIVVIVDLAIAASPKGTGQIEVPLDFDTGVDRVFLLSVMDEVMDIYERSGWDVVWGCVDRSPVLRLTLTRPVIGEGP